MVLNEGYRRPLVNSFNFTVRHHNRTNLYQLQKSLARCRASCRNYLLEVEDKQLPGELVRLGRYEDKHLDVFGVERNICDLGTEYAR